MQRSAPVGFTIILLVGMVAVGGVSAIGAGIDALERTSPAVLDGQAAVNAQEPDVLVTTQEFDRTQFHVTVYENGTARWTFVYTRHLAEDSDAEQFETFAEQFNEEGHALYEDFERQAHALTQAGTNQTGREMTATEFDRTAEVRRELNTIGVVEMSFTWSNFAVVEDDGRVVVSDVFAGGLYIGSTQSIVFEAGEGLQFAFASPAVITSGPNLTESETITWQGEQEFVDRHPRVIFEPVEHSDGQTTSPGGGPDDSGDDDSSTLVVLGALVIVIGVGAFAWYRFGGAPMGDVPPAAGSAPEQFAEPISEDDLISDEDRIVELVRENGGRMKQVDIVDETDWSKSKVSMLLSDMEEEGTISKLRVGRENIISLQGFEPEATRSPFDR